MGRHLLAAAAPLAALAAAALVPLSPAVARHAAAPLAAHARHIHKAAEFAPDDDVQTQIDTLAETIADLNDRLAAIEDAIGSPEDDGAFDGNSEDSVDLARARAVHRPPRLHRAVHSERDAALCPGPAASAATAKPLAAPRAAPLAKGTV